MDAKNAARIVTEALRGSDDAAIYTIHGFCQRDWLVRHIDVLRDAVRRTKEQRPFHIDAWVVLPDHLHCVWTLPPADHDFSNAGKLSRSASFNHCPAPNGDPPFVSPKGERGIWQRRFWEHAIRHDKDYAAYIDYCHFNPVKHGLVERMSDWPHSTFHRYVERGVYPPVGRRTGEGFRSGGTGMMGRSRLFGF